GDSGGRGLAHDLRRHRYAAPGLARQRRLRARSPHRLGLPRPSRNPRRTRALPAEVTGVPIGATGSTCHAPVNSASYASDARRKHEATATRLAAAPAPFSCLSAAAIATMETVAKQVMETRR